MAEEKDTKTILLDENDINLLKKYGMGPYAEKIKLLEEENKKTVAKINKMVGIKGSAAGLSIPSTWDLVADQKLASVIKQIKFQRTSIDSGQMHKNSNHLFNERILYMITIKHIYKYVVGQDEKVALIDMEEGIIAIQLPLQLKIDPSVTMMTVEDKLDVTYNDIDGGKEQLKNQGNQLKCLY